MGAAVEPEARALVLVAVVFAQGEEQDRPAAAGGAELRPRRAWFAWAFAGVGFATAAAVLVLYLRRAEPAEVLDISITETLGRTLATSGTTLLVVIALALFGGEMIFGFAIALLVGITIGTYSSIYIASALVLMMGVTKDDLIPPAKEGIEQDNLTP